MGLFGGDSKSSSSDDDININNVDYGGGASGSDAPINLVSKTDGNYNTSTTNITKSDYGAIQGALDLASSSIDNIASLSARSADSNASLAAQAAQNGGEKTLNKTTLLIGVVLVGAAVITVAVRRMS
jgi:hypothetical protein